MTRAALESLIGAVATAAPLTLESLLTSPLYFGLTTATPLQRAICRMVEGRLLGELAMHPHVRAAMGGATYDGRFPREVVLLAGVRTAKSMLAACVAIWASQHCDLTPASGDGEIPRFSVVSLQKDNARVVHAHLLGALAKPALRPLVVDTKAEGPWTRIINDSGSDVVGSVFLWHPSGRPIEVRVVAGQRAGGSLVSRWSAGGVYDEAARMVGASEGVVNYDDAKSALISRLLPGAQILSIGSPWAPFGPIYEMVAREWGHPIPGRLIIKAQAAWLNPSWWTAERMAALKISDPTAYQTDALAEFADLGEMLYGQELLSRCLTGVNGAPHEEGHEYSAAIDAATRRNAWSLVVATRTGRKKRVVRVCQWQGSPQLPLSPRAVFAEIKDILEVYRLDSLKADAWSFDALQEIAYDLGIYMVEDSWTTKENNDAYAALQVEMSDGAFEGPNDPLYAKDLRSVRKKVTQTGVRIELIQTPDRRHADYAPSTVRAIRGWMIAETDVPPEPKDNRTAEWQDWNDEHGDFEPPEDVWWDRSAG